MAPQFVVTPWRDANELLAVRRDLLAADDAARERAVNKVGLLPCTPEPEERPAKTWAADYRMARAEARAAAAAGEYGRHRRSEAARWEAERIIPRAATGVCDRCLEVPKRLPTRPASSHADTRNADL
jgi:hypothetical protein